MPKISVYLNELSINSQFNGHPWQDGMTEVFKCLDLCRGKNGQISGFYSGDIFTRPFLYDYTLLTTVLKKDPDFNRKFRLYLKDFSRSSSGNLLGLFGNDSDGILLNFQYGPFQDNLVARHFTSSDSLFSYLKSRGLVSHIYDISSSIPPRDDETILADSSVFLLTRHSFQRRKMYQRIGTSELWYVDNFHYGRDAHIEVFNETTKKQINVSRIDKIDFFRPLTDEEKARTLVFDGGK